MPKILVLSFKRVKIVQLLNHTAKINYFTESYLNEMIVLGNRSLLSDNREVDSGGHQAKTRMSRVLLKR